MDDRFAAARAEFPALERCCWMATHALGCLPTRAIEDLDDYLAGWQERCLGVWEEWLPEIDRTAAAVGALFGAPTGTVTMLGSADHASAVIASCFDFGAGRDRVVCSAAGAPGASYVWHAETRRGARVELVPLSDGATDLAALLAAIDERTAVVPLSAVDVRTGAIEDLGRVVARARQVGAVVTLDCTGSLGTVPLDVVDLGVGFAFGGLESYLCGGPGAAYLYVRRDLIDRYEPRVTGWLGHEAPFASAMPAQCYADGIWRYLGGMPSIGALFQARAGLEIVRGLGVRTIRERSLAATERAIAAVLARGFTLRSPHGVAARGPIVAFDFVGAAEVARELVRRRHFCDSRPGVGLRIAPHFYNRDDEVDAFFAELDRVRLG